MVKGPLYDLVKLLVHTFAFYQNRTPRMVNFSLHQCLDPIEYIIMLLNFLINCIFLFISSFLEKNVLKNSLTMNSLLDLDLPLNNYTLPKYQRDFFTLMQLGTSQ